MKPGGTPRPAVRPRCKALFALALPLLATACAALPPSVEPDAKPNPAKWQRVRIQISWNRHEAPHWHVDALLAHRVAAPVLERERTAIRLWRFHRRAADDTAGHSLSLLSYAPADTNARLCRGVRDDPLAATLIQTGTLERIECAPLAADRMALVEGSSDARWSEPLQRAWPHFIMGVSELWLHLIDEHARQPWAHDPAPSVEQTLERYREINEAVTQAWQREGHHALLHHLNGLFGYGPIDVGRGELRRF